MDYKLILLPLAKMDLKETTDWYEGLQKNLGKRFLDAIKNEIKVLKANPLLYQIRYDKNKSCSNRNISLFDTF